MSQLQVTGEAKIRDIQGPVVSNSGVITALDGDASQYVRGDGTLADFPTSTGGGSSVSYYLNSSVSQGTIGGVAYRQLSKTPISGAGTDIAISSNGYVASYITDANDPALLEVPAGNFNCEFYFSVNSNAHNPYVYAELYKYDGTTFTLLGSNQAIPEYLTNGTTLSAYYFAIPVAVAALTITDRLAIRIYVNVDGRVVTLHTENNHLCQVVTTFSKGLISLNNLTRQNQFFATGTSGTDFNISSATATHTFNIPSASATNRGLITTGSQTIAGDKSFTGINSFDYGINYKTGASLANVSGYISQAYATSGTGAGSTLSLKISDGNSVKAINLDFVGSPATYTYTYPALSGTIALLEGTQTFTGLKTFGDSIQAGYGISLYNGIGTGALVSATYTGFYAAKSGTYTNVTFAHDGDPFFSRLKLLNNATYDYTFPAASGTIALTSNLSSYVPYTGATANVDLGSRTLTTSNNISASSFIGQLAVILGTSSYGGTVGLYPNATYTLTDGYLNMNASSATKLNLAFGQGSNVFKYAILDVTGLTNGTNRTYALQDASGTIALLSGTQTFSGDTTFSSDITVNGVRVGKGGGSLSTNTILGTSSLNANTTGSENTALGWNSLPNNTTGASNTGVGGGSLQQNTTGSSNTALGYATLTANTTGTQNVAVGVGSLQNNTTASYNVAIGTSALSANTTGNSNTSVGNGSLIQNTTGIANTSIGYASLSVNTTGSYNVSVGGGNGNALTTGSNNLLIGYNTGNGITTGSNNTIIGGGVSGLSSSLANNIILADGAGNIRYQWNGTNNVFGNPISGTSATFSGALTLNAAANQVRSGNELRFYRTDNGIYTQLYDGGGANGFVLDNRNGDGFNFQSAGTSQFRIASTGAATFSSSVGINGGDFRYRPNGDVTNSPALVFKDAGNSALDICAEVIGDANASSRPIAFRVSNPDRSRFEAMRITSGGNVGIGTSSPSALLHIAATGNDPVLISNSGASSYNSLILSNNNNFKIAIGIGGGSVGGNLQDNGYIGTISNRDLLFNTNNTEKMRITAGGNVGINNTGLSFVKFRTKGDSSTSSDYSLSCVNAASTDTFWVRNDGVINTGSAANSPYNRTTGSLGNLFVDFDGSLYRGTASSQRFKENIIDWNASGLDTILALKPKTFTYKEDYYSQPERQFLGLIAEEVAEVSPLLADFKNEDGSGEVENVRYATIVVPLIKAIQELEARIKQLENK